MKLPDDLRERLDRADASFDWKQGFTAGWLAREMESKEEGA